MKLKYLFLILPFWNSLAIDTKTNSYYEFTCKEPVQAYSGVWVKACYDQEGRKHLFVADRKENVEPKGGAHQHHWQGADGNYYIQLTDKESPYKLDKAGHLLPKDTRHLLAGEYLDKVFDRFFN